MGVELPDLPATIKDVAIVDFLQKYYELSNKADDNEDFVALFTADGEYVINGKTAKGHDEINALRRAMFAHIPERIHNPINIYTHGDDELNLMAHGDVTHKHHYGHDADSDWAAIYNLVKVGDEYKFSKIHIIANSGAHV